MDVASYLEQKEIEALHDTKFAQLEFETVKISLNIDDNLDRRIRYISSELELKRSEFMRDLMTLALYEFEQHLGLDPLDFDEPYANYVYAGMNDFKVGPITITKEQFIEMIKASRRENEEAATNE